MILELISYQIRDRNFTIWLENTIREHQIEIIGTAEIPFVYTDGKNAEIVAVLGKMENFTIPKDCKDRQNLPEFVNDAEHLREVLKYHHISVDDSAEQMIANIFENRLVTVHYLQEEDS